MELLPFYNFRRFWTQIWPQNCPVGSFCVEYVYFIKCQINIQEIQINIQNRVRPKICRVIFENKFFFTYVIFEENTKIIDDISLNFVVFAIKSYKIVIFVSFTYKISSVHVFNFRWYPNPDFDPQTRLDPTQ